MLVIKFIVTRHKSSQEQITCKSFWVKKLTFKCAFLKYHSNKYKINIFLTLNIDEFFLQVLDGHQDIHWNVYRECRIWFSFILCRLFPLSSLSSESFTYFLLLLTSLEFYQFSQQCKKYIMNVFKMRCVIKVQNQ